MGRFSMTSQDIAAKMANTESKFHHASRQILVLNVRVNEAQTLYDHSLEVRRRPFRHSSLVRLKILKSVSDDFYEYATRRATEMDDFLLTLMESFYYKMQNTISIMFNFKNNSLRSRNDR